MGDKGDLRNMGKTHLKLTGNIQDHVSPIFYVHF